MNPSVCKIVHSYHSENMDSIDRAEIFIYRSALILVGFQNHNEAFVSFVHYQFNDLPIDDIYATQIQMIENDIPEIFKKAITKNVYHAEPQYVLVPFSEFQGINPYEMFSELHSKGSEKLLTDDLLAIGAKEIYNYPFRVYNDAANAFENAQFSSYHKPLFHKLKQASGDFKSLFVSIKSKNVELVGFYRGNLLYANSFEYKSNADVLYFIQAVLQDLGISNDSEHIYITTIQKEEQQEIFEFVKTNIPNFNQNVASIFGCPEPYWNSYGDVFLCS